MSSKSEDMKEIILFNISDILCGMEIQDVLEIKRVVDITTVYGAPEVVKGVINLRGQIVTVLDIRNRFGIKSLEFTGAERIIITPFMEEQVGLLVDSVDDVILFESSSILPVPPNMNRRISRFFHGVFQWNNCIVSLIELEQIVQINDNKSENVIGG